MIKSELVQKIADRYPELYQRDAENVVNAILDEIGNALARGTSLARFAKRGTPTATIRLAKACATAGAELVAVDSNPIDALWRAIAALPSDLKAALLLRDVVGMPYAEIAETLEISLANVKWRIYRAREDVAQALDREGVGPETRLASTAM